MKELKTNCKFGHFKDHMDSKARTLLEEITEAYDEMDRLTNMGFIYEKFNQDARDHSESLMSSMIIELVVYDETEYFRDYND